MVRVTVSVQVAEKKSVCTFFGSFCRIRFDWSPKEPSASISSACGVLGMGLGLVGVALALVSGERSWDWC